MRRTSCRKSKVAWWPMSKSAKRRDSTEESSLRNGVGSRKNYPNIFTTSGLGKIGKAEIEAFHGRIERRWIKL